MIGKKLDLRVDVAKLREFFYRVVARYAPVMQSPSFGGWSILSSTGHYTDGWQRGHLCFKQYADGTPYFDGELAKAMRYVPNELHVLPTQLCEGYVLEVIEQIRALGLKPCRARWSLLKSRGASTWHRDGMDHEQAVRLHIPVITNPHCLFKTELEAEHMPADGSVSLVRVNRMHQVINKGDTERIHIIMNVDAPA